MFSEIINFPLLVVAGLAAGGWIFVSGLIMAATFGYRDMKTAFDIVGLPLPAGIVPFVTHTVVRFITGMALVALFAIMLNVFSQTMALFAAAGFTWLLGVVLPFAVVVQWGLFTWAMGLIHMGNGGKAVGLGRCGAPDCRNHWAIAVPCVMMA